MVKAQLVQTESVKSAGTRPYSPALRVGDHLHLSGQVPIDAAGNTVGAGDPAGQWRQCFENIKELVEVVGGSMKDIYFLNIYVTDMRVYMEHGEIRKEYLTPPYPASTVIQVGSLAQPDWFIEIEARAYLGD